MTNEPGQDDYGAVCPYLGLADDADSHATYATEAHRCFRLPNPTRIATGHQETYCLGAGHVSCPVYLGEGVPGAQKAAAAGGAATAAKTETPTRGAPKTPPQPSGQVRGPRSDDTAPTRPMRERPVAGGARPGRRPPTGTVGPRPRSGGVSLPVLTVALFALAIVVVGLAFAINEFSGGGSSSGIPQVARNQTATAAAAGAGKTTPAASTTQGGQTTPRTGTPGATTPGAGTPAGGTPGATATGGAASKSYTVKSGDTCSGIAAANNVDLQVFLDLNKLTDESCRALAVGQILKLP